MGAEELLMGEPPKLHHLSYGDIGERALLLFYDCNQSR